MIVNSASGGKEAVVASSEVSSWNLCRRTKKYHINLWTISAAADVQTRDLLD
jgi:hypothetical protein